MQNLSIAIIGGGLSGLYTARLLTQMNIPCHVFEARGRLGGRILSTPGDGTGHDLGPSWFWPDFQPRMAALVSALGLGTFAQHSEGAMLVERSAQGMAKPVAGFESGSPSMRVRGGVGQVTQALAASLAPEQVLMNARVVGMRLHRPGVALQIETPQGALTRVFTHVITAVPPRLLAQDMGFEPPLPATTLERWAHTPTWMAPHAKYVARYQRPFWRDSGLSGMAQSHVGPMVEIHDASDAAASAALFGFVGVPAVARRALGEAALLEQCRLQLVRLFGPAAASPVAHYLKDWAADPLTATQRDREHQQGHFSRGYRTPARDGWSPYLFVAGSEASTEHNGYMEGALEAAQLAVEALCSLLQGPQPA